jgi:nucleotide-binding universal stress UspA family protein
MICLMFSKILVPVAFSARCQGAMLYAERLANDPRSELVLLHVVAPIPAYGYSDVETVQIDVTAEILTQAKAQLETFGDESLKGFAVRRVVLPGDPAQGIVKFASDGKIDLIVMPTHGYGPFRRFLLGSVTAKVLHDAGCPVCTGPHMEQSLAHPPGKIERVLCGIDLGSESLAVLQRASSFARDNGADLTVVHVIHPITKNNESEWNPELANEARERISELEEDLGITGEIVIKVGETPQAIRTVAEDSAADFLVIGRGHAAGVVGRLRTNAYTIIRESPCPVIAI